MPLLNDKKEFLEFLRGHYPMVHLSNLFYPDMEKGVHAFLASRKFKLKTREVELATKEFIDMMEKEGIFLRFDHKTWTLNFPAFQTPSAHKIDPAPLQPAQAPGLLRS